MVGVAPPLCTSSPVKVALLIRVALPNTKSSALSISNTPPLSGRVADAIMSVTPPVLNVNGNASAGTASMPAAMAAQRNTAFTKNSLGVVIGHLSKGRLIVDDSMHRAELRDCLTNKELQKNLNSMRADV